MIDEPGGGRHYGGDVAGPVFASVMGGALRTLGVAPDSPLPAEGNPPAVRVALAAKEPR
jgi:cell division protein FtsI (penicillin-binding protein 3)